MQESKRSEETVAQSNDKSSRLKPPYRLKATDSGKFIVNAHGLLVHPEDVVAALNQSPLSAERPTLPCGDACMDVIGCAQGQPCLAQAQGLAIAKTPDAPAAYERPTDWISEVLREIQEMPDRTSPDDFPEAMLVTAKELRTILESNAPAFAIEPTEAMLQAALDADVGALDTPLRELYRLIYVAMRRAGSTATKDAIK